MNKAKNIYIADDEAPREINKYKVNAGEYKQIPAYDFQDELRLVYVGWQHSGSYYIFEDSKGFRYYMSEHKFREVVKSKEITIKGTFGFFQHGAIQSIGLV